MTEPDFIVQKAKIKHVGIRGNNCNKHLPTVGLGEREEVRAIELRSFEKRYCRVEPQRAHS